MVRKEAEPALLELHAPHGDRATEAQPARPASPIEERFWLMHQLYAGEPVCNEAIALRLRGKLRVDALATALDGVVQAHPPLRTRYAQQGTALEAEPRPIAGPILECVDAEAAADPAVLQRMLRAEAAYSFDLFAPPLMRARLLRIRADDCVLVLVFHHIAADGRSFLHVVPRELSSRYAAALCGEPRDPVDVAAGYDEFARQSRASEHGPDAERSIAQMREVLAGAPAQTPLPTDNPHPPSPSMRGDRLERRLPAATREGVEQCARELELRPFDIACAAFAAQLMRYGECHDLVLGTPVANRTPEQADLVGCFIDTLPLRLDFERAPSFAALAHRIHERRVEARSQRVPSFGRLVDALTVARDTSRAPLVQVMFNYLNFALNPLDLAGLEVDAYRVGGGTSMLDLSLDVSELADGGYLVCLEYNGDVFRPAHAERMLEHYVQLLQSALRDPGAELGALALVDARELARIDALARGPELDAAAPNSFYTLIAERAAGVLDAPALHSQHGVLSYRELLARAAALAAELQRHGLGPGDFAALLYADPSATVVAMLAVLRAGGAYVPLDASAPPARCRAIVRDSGASLLLGDAAEAPHWLPPNVRYLHAAPDEASPGSEAVPPAQVGAAAPAYVIYTSGSSGPPRGVIVEHRQLVHQVLARIARYGWGAPGLHLAPYSFAFDSSLASLSWALACGATLRLLPDDSRKDPRVLRDVIARERITHIDLVPSMYAALLELAESHELASLEVVVCGGEALPRAVVEAHRKKASAARLFNEYGPTEATVFASVHEVSEDPPLSSTPIGRPIASGQCWVCDAGGALVPLGHVGELWIGGRGVAAGYVGQPEQTAVRFVTATHALAKGARCYRSGDLVRMRDDGVLEFIGRNDAQIQIRGYRVEPAEVEGVLGRAPDIEAAFVTACDDARGNRRLVAYVTRLRRRRPPRELDVAELRTLCRRLLPAYMVPNAIVELPSLPLTANGKVDREALPVPDFERTEAAAYVEPSTDTERAVIAIFAQLLGSARIGARDSFFDVGGHSLLAIQLIGAIERRYGTRLDLVDVFREPTAQALAMLIESRGSLSTPGGTCVEVLVNSGERLPLAFTGSTRQARVLAQRLEPHRWIYGLNMFGLHGAGHSTEVEVERLAAAFVKQLRAARPRGPYCLAGYCEDSKVAVEMARQLQAGGERVAFLGLLDGVWLLPELQVPGGRAQRWARSLREHGVGLVAEKIRRRAQESYEKMRVALSRAERELRIRLRSELPTVLEHRLLVTQYLEALARFQPARHAGIAHLYIASEWGISEQTRTDLAQRALHVREVPGSHDGLFEGAPLERLGRMLQADLERADAEHAGSR